MMKPFRSPRLFRSPRASRAPRAPRPEIKFHSSVQQDFLNELTDLGCSNIGDHYTRQQLVRVFGPSHPGLSELKTAEQVCERVMDDAPQPFRTMDACLLSPSERVFDDDFFRLVYVADTSGDMSAAKGGGADRYDRHRRFTDRDRHEWLQVLSKYDDATAWEERIFQQLRILQETPTGDMILSLLATLHRPGEITITNKNPTRLSANTNTLIVNIPSVPRGMCYIGPDGGLINSQLWLVLGHEFIHLIHAKLGIHNRRDMSAEEENTIQGVILDRDGDGKISSGDQDLSLIRVGDKLWHLTENQFRKEHQMAARNGYDSIPVCAVFEKRGCALFDKYGDDTCSVLQSSSDPAVRRLYDTLSSHR